MLDILHGHDSLLKFSCCLIWKLGYVTDEEVKQRESKLRDALKNDLEFGVKVGSEVEVAQVIP